MPIHAERRMHTAERAWTTPIHAEGSSAMLQVRINPLRERFEMQWAGFSLLSFVLSGANSLDYLQAKHLRKPPVQLA